MWAPAWWVKVIGPLLVGYRVVVVVVVGGRPSCCGLLHATAAPEVEPEVWMEVRGVKEEDLMRMMRSRWRADKLFFFSMSICPP